ncbi:MAG: spore coat associated protein CotJA, partial [Oscillospiraceae bacterium]|nr:spore coat associated protein CotJA [Oscillospiraceae bacterium]
MDNLPVNPSRTPRLGFPIESRPLPNGGDDEAVRLPPEISTAPKPARPETAPAAEPAGPPPAEISALTEADFAGDMPRTGMLGNAYVPFQKPGRKYARGEGLSKGTLFPGLDLPFKNYTANREVANTPLGELMAVG